MSIKRVEELAAQHNMIYMEDKGKELNPCQLKQSLRKTSKYQLTQQHHVNLIPLSIKLPMRCLPEGNESQIKIEIDHSCSCPTSGTNHIL